MILVTSSSARTSMIYTDIVPLPSGVERCIGRTHATTIKANIPKSTIIRYIFDKNIYILSILNINNRYSLPSHTSFAEHSYLIRSRYFGRKAYGSIQGSSVILSAPISFLAPVYTGWVYDSTGRYITALILFAALASFAILLMLLIRVPKPSDTINT
jgi:hypothetical protein